jgi:hypothetical protein
MNKTLVIGLVVIGFWTQLYGAVMQQGEFIREKGEIQKLKKDLDLFYKDKESGYKKQKDELTALDKEIKDKLDKIEAIKVENQKILDEIDRKIVDKSMLLYEKMKLKVVFNILKEKADSGNLNDVFDIMIRLKEKRVMELLKLFDTKTATELMDKMKNHKSKNKVEEKK